MQNDTVLVKLFTVLLFSLLLLSFFAIYSVSGAVFDEYVKKHLLTIIFSISISLFVARINSQFIYDNAFAIYLAVLFLLIVTLFIGHKAMGAQRWINFGILNLQPAEFAKIAVILVLAQYFHNVHSNFINKFSTWVLPLLMVLLPVLLILKQPNLGTAMIIILNAIVILYLAGIKTIYFLVTGLCCLAAIPAVWLVMHDYQKQRVLTFIDPGSDPLGAGYNILQSMISIGSGGLFGKGFVQGSQNQLKFLPENHTDFIFALIAEEGGFILCFLVFLLYMGILFLLLIFSHKSSSQFQRLFIGGFAALLFIQVSINIAMISGMLPVVGVPLPFLSFGGSNILAMSLGIGLVLNFFLNKEQNY